MPLMTVNQAEGGHKIHDLFTIGQISEHPHVCGKTSLSGNFQRQDLLEIVLLLLDCNDEKRDNSHGRLNENKSEYFCMKCWQYASAYTCL